MSDLSFYYGPNAGYVFELYERYKQDPVSVDPETRAIFDRWTPEPPSPSAGQAAAAPSGASASGWLYAKVDVARVAAVARLARFIRQRGHLIADIDPLNLRNRSEEEAELDLQSHGLTTQDLAMVPASIVGGPQAAGSKNALEAIQQLRQVYSGKIGYEDEHIQDAEERYWLRDSAESGRFFQDMDADTKRDLLERLTEVEAFEQFLQRNFPGEKRFSIEGTDTLVPILDEIIRSAAATGTREVVLGMAHRGRLNVLAHVLGKPYEAILAQFREAHHKEGASVAGKGSQGWTGDVKYHLGHRRAYKESGIAEMPLTLVNNPSHLEYVNPVLEGHARASQDQRSHAGPPTQDVKAALPILIHGDAAFPGQGIVAETLNLSGLRGYSTGGTIHIIANNQIGFTTTPPEGRSTLYASDLAKGFDIPIVHVNADDPLACLAAARMAHAYRERYHKDFLIDLIGYRRYGHNEGDEPEYTQPQMYAIVRAHPSVRALWAQTLEREGVVTAEDAAAMLKAAMDKLKEALKGPVPQSEANLEDMHGTGSRSRKVETAVPAERLKALNAALLARPAGFAINPKLERQFQRWRTALEPGGKIEWGQAEALAFASILAQGTPIRLAGQDTERGTFSHRHAVLHDPKTDAAYIPLQALPEARASFAIINSPLSENAVLGFEYGYSIHAPGVLVLWEAQFGDFANSAQVIIDQFLVSGAAKWRQNPSLVLLLPHGYEGQGPEHSSARLERFLQLAADDNIQIANCTTSGQYFHLLRRQATLLETDPRPLVIFTPKSLLRSERAASSLEELTQGGFRPVLDDARARAHPEEVTRLVLCSGKVYVDLVNSPAYAQAERIAVARIEELYPFPAGELQRVIAGYPNLRELVWLQEEPRNMGAWSFVQPRLFEQVGWEGPVCYIGRSASASPAEGSTGRHYAEQGRILAAVLEDVPSLHRERSEIRHAS